MGAGDEELGFRAHGVGGDDDVGEVDGAGGRHDAAEAGG